MSIRQRNAHFTNWAAVCKAFNLSYSSDEVANEATARTALESSDNKFYYYVCYIKSAQVIYTHGEFYDCSYGKDEEAIAAALSSLATTKVGSDNLKTINGESLVGAGDLELALTEDVINSSDKGWRPMRMNGSDIYWSKIASISSENIASGGRDAWIEVEVNGNTNYPNACRFVIQITQYLNSAISVAVFGGASPIPRDGVTGPKPCVTVDANRNVWLKILNAQWDMYAAIRPLKQDAFGTISILGKAVADGGHSSNFETQVDAPASTFLEGYGGLRYTISSGTYTLTGAVIDATATDAKKLGGVAASEYAKTDELKTINGQSLVGSGDITIEYGGLDASELRNTLKSSILLDSNETLFYIMPEQRYYLKYTSDSNDSWEFSPQGYNTATDMCPHWFITFDLTSG